MNRSCLENALAQEIGRVRGQRSTMRQDRCGLFDSMHLRETGERYVFMKGLPVRDYLIPIFVAILAVWTPGTAAAQVGTAAPQGSYQRSCTQIAYNPTTTNLSAYCAFQPSDPFDGTFSPLLVSYCEPGADIENIRGWLQCSARAGTWGRLGAVPNGSYQQSCWNWDVSTQSVLTARCHRFNGRSRVITDGFSDDMVDAQLNLSQCSMSGDIENIRGQLICVPASSH